MKTRAILALADGSIFKGISIGAQGSTVGEVVFNTAMTGYQEILTDPSYAKQIVTLTYPHIGNTGINRDDVESDDVWAAGLIIRDLPMVTSSWRAEKSLSEYLTENNIVAIADIDTRRLTRILREKGAQSGYIITLDALDTDTEHTEAELITQAQQFSGLAGMDLAQEVTCAASYQWTEPTWQLAASITATRPVPEQKFHVVAYDFGVKKNILRMLVDRGCQVTVVPAKTPVEDVLALSPDGVFLSNGPGDPEPCTYAIDAIKVLLDKNMPLFGICLGHQLLALASGAKTIKMKFGHHGANHPVQDLASKQVWITSQNHGFAADESTLPANVKVTHTSLFDGSLQGIELTDKPAFSFQGHPEASPGPHDADGLFDHFIDLMTAAQSSNA